MIKKILIASFMFALSFAYANEKEALDHWQKIYEVFSHPRCANCHVPKDNRPRWSGPSYGKKWSYHSMYVHGGESRMGAESALVCGTCHMKQNSPEPHGPPGAEVWALAPVEMTWWQKSSKEICQQIKDLKRNGNRSLEQVAHHVEHDELVLWGWEPGLGRERAPYSGKETAQFIRAWQKAGAPCPKN